MNSLPALLTSARTLCPRACIHSMSELKTICVEMLADQMSQCGRNSWASHQIDTVSAWNERTGSSELPTACLILCPF